MQAHYNDPKLSSVILIVAYSLSAFAESSELAVCGLLTRTCKASSGYTEYKFPSERVNAN